MANFDHFYVIIINVYLLSIFATLIKSKTITPIYRFFKLLVIALAVYAIVLIFIEDVPIVEGILFGLPLLLIILVTSQTEFILILKKLGFKGTGLFHNTLEDAIKIELIKSLDFLSGKKIGALITFEKTTSLDEYISGAYNIDAPLNSELLSTIFFPNTPLHDGAVIVRGDKIVCAGTYFPPTERLDIPKQLGSRHRAAIGISELSDSLTIIVSEETGNISVAVDGYLDMDVNKESIIQYVEKHLQN